MKDRTDFRHVYLEGMARHEREERERLEKTGKRIVLVIACLVVLFGFVGLSIQSGLEEMRRIEAERIAY